MLSVIHNHLIVVNNRELTAEEIFLIEEWDSALIYVSSVKEADDFINYLENEYKGE